MLVPSIDLEGGQAVQLIGGETPAIEAGDPLPIARRFGRIGEIAVIDLDAARSIGSNAALIESLIEIAEIRVGGGIRTVEDARWWLDRGAAKVILGTAAKPEILSRLPKDRVIAALDARHGEVVIEGWRKGTGSGVLERVAELREHVSGFLATFVEREGRMEGSNLPFAREIVEAAGEARVTIAGGVTTAEEIAELDRMGADAQVGMALYSGALSLTDAFAAPLITDRPDGLFHTVIVDERDAALGFAFSSRASIEAALERGVGVYHSRRRGLWVKGESSGATQELLGIDVDCDRDCLRFRVRQRPPGFCHLETPSCWGETRGLARLEGALIARAQSAPEGSYVAKLFADPALLAAKLKEETGELIQARERADVIHEAADVLFFTLARLAREGVAVEEVERELDRRARKVTRRD